MKREDKIKFYVTSCVKSLNWVLQLIWIKDTEQFREKPKDAVSPLELRSRSKSIYNQKN